MDNHIEEETIDGIEQQYAQVLHYDVKDINKKVKRNEVEQVS
jgi:hypothetical protein